MPKKTRQGSQEQWRKIREQAQAQFNEHVEERGARPKPGGTIEDPEVLEYMRRYGVTRIRPAEAMETEP